ncbi:MAG: AAA family ATPase [Campylobacterales bacterium]
MILESLKLQNFKRYASYDIEFENGLCGILGRNGSGKSTILEAIFFALYGDIKGQKELLPTAGSEGSVKVELEFSIDEKTYTATREFRGKNLTAYASLKCGDDSLASGAKEVTAYVTKLIGMGKDAFLHTVFASQKELTALSSMKNEERKAMMRRLLGLEKIDKIEEMIKDELRELNRDIKAADSYLLSEEAVKQYTNDIAAKSEVVKQLEIKIKSVMEDGGKLKAAHESAKKAVEAQQKAKEERLKKQQILEQTKQALQMLEKQHMAQTEELKELQTKDTYYKANLPLKTQLEAIEKSLTAQEELKAKFLKKDGLEKEQAQLRIEYANRKDEVASLTKELEPLEAMQKLLTEQKAKITELKAASEKLTQEINKLNSDIAANKSKIQDVQKRIGKIEELGRESACPVCTRPLLEQYDAVVSSLQNEITAVYQKSIDEITAVVTTKTAGHSKLQKELAEAEQKASETDKLIGVLTSKSKDLQKAKERFEDAETRGKANKELIKELGDIKYDEAEHKKIQTQKESLKPQVEALIKLEALISTIPEKTKALQASEESIKSTKTALEQATKTLEQDTYGEKVHMEAVENAKKAEAAKDANTAEHQKLSLEHIGIVKDIEALQKELRKDEEQRAAIKSKELAKNDYEKLRVIMGEFKTHINARVAPRIGEVASDMYSRITRGKYQLVEVTPEFEFFIYDGGERYPIERFSGGEIDLANLVLRIAISKTLGELSGGGNIGFLAFDEVFGSQDEERRFRIMEAFHTISESYRQIFLISHETEIKEMFERVVEL